MKTFENIKVKETSNFLELELLNGNIIIPKKPDGYVISSGCGSGKTTVIKQLISNNFQYGVLYSASTIDECNSMYQYCKTIKDSHGNIIDPSSIIVLHSDYKSEGTDNNLWRNNPEELLNKKIIICTHAKLLNEYPEFLIQYNGNPVFESYKSHTQRAVSSRIASTVRYLPRRYVLIDELPTYSSIHITFNKTLLRLLGDRSGVWIDTGELDNNGNPKRSFVPDKPIRFIPIQDFNELISSYNEISEEDKSLKFFSSNTIQSKMKTEMILDVIRANYYDYFYNSGDNNTLSVRYNVSDLISTDPKVPMETSILLFDGTGDLTFKGSKKFKVLNLLGNKYSSPIIFNKFNTNLPRYITDKVLKKINIENELKNNIDKLEWIIRNSPSGVLIVTWMNLKSDKLKLQNSTLSYYCNTMNDEFDLPGYYKSELIKRGLISGYEIIHYMSGLDKATNIYKDFESIAFMGEFHVPENVIEEFNCEYDCNTDTKHYSMYQLVQAICRTRIRKHNGESINIYYSSDWNDNLMKDINSYLSGNNNIKLYDYTLSFVKNKWKDSLYKLDTVLNGLIDNIIRKIETDYTITLSNIYELIPLSEKKVRSYYPLINYLNNLGISLNITE